MAQGTETLIQVAQDSTGKKVRNLSVTAKQADGSIATVLMQVVAIARPNGELMDLDADVFSETLRVLKQIRWGLSQQLEIDLSEVEV